MPVVSMLHKIDCYEGQCIMEILQSCHLYDNHRLSLILMRCDIQVRGLFHIVFMSSRMKSWENSFTLWFLCLILLTQCVVWVQVFYYTHENCHRVSQIENKTWPPCCYQGPLLVTDIRWTATEIKTWINNHIFIKHCVVITHPCLYVNDSFMSMTV